MAKGKVAYFGSAAKACGYFERHFGLRCPELTNPADFLMEITNSDFEIDRQEGADVDALIAGWAETEEAREVAETVARLKANRGGGKEKEGGLKHKQLGFADQLPILLSRTFTGYLRDPTVRDHDLSLSLSLFQSRS